MGIKWCTENDVITVKPPGLSPLMSDHLLKRTTFPKHSKLFPGEPPVSIHLLEVTASTFGADGLKFSNWF